MLGKLNRYNRQATGWTAEVRLSIEERNFLYYRIQIGSGAQPISYPIGTDVSFLGAKVAGV
jgi:hypothetical protein